MSLMNIVAAGGSVHSPSTLGRQALQAGLGLVLALGSATQMPWDTGIPDLRGSLSSSVNGGIPGPTSQVTVFTRADSSKASSLVPGAW